MYVRDQDELDIVKDSWYVLPDFNNHVIVPCYDKTINVLGFDFKVVKIAFKF